MNVQTKTAPYVNNYGPHPHGLEPEPRTVDTFPEVHQQLKKPIIPENRKSGDDFMNVQTKMAPYVNNYGPKPRGLEPEPRTVDTFPEIHQ